MFFTVIDKNTTHIMFYKERFIRNNFLTSQIFEKFKEQTSHFPKNQGTPL